MKSNYNMLRLGLLNPGESKEGKMKDKYDKMLLENIDANQLFEDITNEINVVLSHIDILEAIVDSNCIALNLRDVFRKIDNAFDIITVIEKDKDQDKIANRFQSIGEDDA